jgi:hypothetical protein
VAFHVCGRQTSLQEESSKPDISAPLASLRRNFHPSSISTSTRGEVTPASMPGAPLEPPELPEAPEAPEPEAPQEPLLAAEPGLPPVSPHAHTAIASDAPSPTLLALRPSIILYNKARSDGRRTTP